MSAHARSSSRWRLFADAVAVALGVNIWASLVLLPGHFVGAWHGSAGLTAAALPLLVLAVGLWRRNEVVLLLAYPTSLLLPLAAAPEMASAHVYGPTRAAVVALGLVAYLFGASVFTSFYEPPPPVRVRPLASASDPVPARWRRRFRVYAGLSVLSVVFPAVLLYVINFEPTGQEYLRQMYPGRAALFTTFLNLGAIAVWVLLYVVFFLGALRPHRTGDADLLGQLGALRRQAGRRRPRPLFYAGVVVALALMAFLLWLRS